MLVDADDVAISGALIAGEAGRCARRDTYRAAPPPLIFDAAAAFSARRLLRAASERAISPWPSAKPHRPRPLLRMIEVLAEQR